MLAVIVHRHAHVVWQPTPRSTHPSEATLAEMQGAFF
jgi:hypothetical protein